MFLFGVLPLKLRNKNLYDKHLKIKKNAISQCFLLSDLYLGIQFNFQFNWELILIRFPYYKLQFIFHYF